MITHSHFQHHTGWSKRISGTCSHSLLAAAIPGGHFTTASPAMPKVMSGAAVQCCERALCRGSSTATPLEFPFPDATG